MSIEYFLLYQDGVHWQTMPAIIEWDPAECSLLDFMYQAIGCSSIETVCFRNFSGDEMGIVGRMLVGLRGERNGEPDIVGYPSKRDAWHAHCQIMNHIHKM